MSKLTTNDLTILKKATFSGKICFNKKGGCNNTHFRGPVVFEEDLIVNRIKSGEEPLTVENCLEVCEPIKTNVLEPKSGTDINVMLGMKETFGLDTLIDLQSPSSIDTQGTGVSFPPTGSASATGSMLGGARRVYQENISSGLNSVIQNNPNEITVNTGAGGLGFTDFIWDGSTTAGNIVNGIGLGGINLLVNGGNTFIMKVSSADTSFEFTVTIYTNNTDFSSVTIVVPPIPLELTEIAIPLSMLNIVGGTGADLSNVGAIKATITIIPSLAIDMSIRGFCISSPGQELCVDTIMTNNLSPKTNNVRIIDDYQTLQPEIFLSLLTPTMIDGEVGVNGSMIGAARRSYLLIQGPFGRSSLTSSMTPSLLLSCPGVNSTLYLTYDGSTTGGNTINFPGLGGIDLTENSGDRFRVSFDFIGGMEYFIEVYTDAGNYSVSSTESYPSTENFVSDEFEFSSFTIGAGTGADFTNVGAIRICANNVINGCTWSLRQFEIVVNESFGRIKVPDLSYKPANPASWTSGQPNSIQSALDRLIGLI